MCNNGRKTLISGKWLLPVTGSPIRRGGVIISRGRLMAFGERTSLQKRFCPEESLEYPGVLMPTLCNSHHHLELSCFGTVSSFTAGADESPMTGWIGELLKRRENPPPVQLQRDAIRDEINRQIRDGVGIIVDTGNGDFLDLFPDISGSPYTVYFMQELLAPARPLLQKSLETVSDTSNKGMFTVHGPCSTPPSLLQEVKRRAAALHHPYSIHTAESAEEVTFVKTGEGPFRDFLLSRGGDPSLFPFSLNKGQSPVQYLDQLGLLDSATLLVHGVHTTDADLEIIARKRATVCLCPVSNEYIGVGMARVEEMVKGGISLALGTDSRTSNPATSMWEEMKMLRKNFSALKPRKILEIATVGGRRWLQHSGVLRSRAEGADVGWMGEPALLHVDGSDLREASTGKDIEDILTSGGRPETCEIVRGDGPV